MNVSRPFKALVAGVSIVAFAGLSQLPAGAATPSPIAQRYADPATSYLLGAPTGKEFSVAGGSQRDYQWGSLYYSKSTGVHEVHGAIWWKYKDLGGPNKFGFPTTDEKQIINNIHGEFVNYGAENTFTKGEIVWNNGTNVATWMETSVAKLWNDQTFPYYGMPTGDEVSKSGYKQVSFNDNTDVFVSSNGAHAVIDGDALVSLHWMNRGYKAEGGVTGYLGVPTSDAISISNDLHAYGYVQHFVGGDLYNNGAGGTFAVRGAINWTYLHNNGLATLGFPTANEKDAPGGRISTFDHGSILWNSATNKTTITYTK